MCHNMPWEAPATRLMPHLMSCAPRITALNNAWQYSLLTLAREGHQTLLLGLGFFELILSHYVHLWSIASVYVQKIRWV